MSKVFLFFVGALLVTSISCTNAAKPPVAVKEATPKPAPTQDAHKDDGHDAPRISLADAKKAFDDKTAVFVDTHAKAQFDLEHIPRAINVQANTIKQNFDKIPKGKKIIAYCS